MKKNKTNASNMPTGAAYSTMYGDKADLLPKKHKKVDESKRSAVSYFMKLLIKKGQKISYPEAAVKLIKIQFQMLEESLSRSGETFISLGFILAYLNMTDENRSILLDVIAYTYLHEIGHHMLRLYTGVYNRVTPYYRPMNYFNEYFADMWAFANMKVTKERALEIMHYRFYVMPPLSYTFKTDLLASAQIKK